MVNPKILPQEIRKRDGRVVPFDQTKISNAIWKAAQSVGGEDRIRSEQLSDLVVGEILAKFPSQTVPSVEDIQDLVEKVLIQEGHAQTAKAYILYRKKRSELRGRGIGVSDTVREEFRENKRYFKNSLAEFIYYRTYSRWVEEKGRRETWSETVSRFMEFMREHLGDRLSLEDSGEVQEAILSQKIVPSMRLVWASGPAIRATNVAAYNCAFISPSKLQDFGEIVYVLMCGSGVGFSVESRSVQSLPQISLQTGTKRPPHVVGDNKEGWADAFVLGLTTWFNGEDITFDYSKLRPAGARLKTMGGRSSGPKPLMDLMDFARDKIFKRQGKRLSSLDVHDIVCKIGEIVVSGGVRRSSLISLSDLDDYEMRQAKFGQFYLTEPQRSMANNSAVYNEKPTPAEFLDEWLTLIKSGSGERGIFNRQALEKQLPARRWEKFKDHASSCGFNPCGEIVLRSKQFCNLTSIVVRPEDTLRSLLRKIRLATILGTYQASLVYFPYLSEDWKRNCEEEALLGVSFTGYWDNFIIRNDEVLRQLREEAVRVNKEYAQKFGVNPSTCVTCVKPSGNSSQLLDTASGMHPRFSKYYVRRVRISATDPLFKMIKDQGVPYYPEVGQVADSATTFVVEFPIKAPEGAVLKDNVSALELLEHWKLIKVNFTEHNPSATIYVGEDEWLEVANWLYTNWDIIGGLSFLPRSDHVYELAPYEEIDQATYEKLVEQVAPINFSKLSLYEREDNTQGAKEFACVAGGCEI